MRMEPSVATRIEELTRQQQQLPAAYDQQQLSAVVRPAAAISCLGPQLATRTRWLNASGALLEAGGGVGRESEATEAMLLVEEERESGPRPWGSLLLLLLLALKLLVSTGEPVSQSP